MSFLDNLENHSLRTKVRVAWIGNTLRLEARDRRLELRPTAAGIVAVSIENGNETAGKLLDLSGNPEQLIREWLCSNDLAGIQHAT